MTVNPTDKFLVNRSGSSYHVEQQNLMAQLEDDDLLLVNRNSKSYKITGAEFKGSLSSPPVIQSVTLTEDDPDGDRFTSQDFTTTAVMLDNGNPTSTKSIRGWVEGSLIETIETDEITNVSPDGLTLTFSGDKDLAKLQPGDSIIQNERTPLSTEYKDLTFTTDPAGFYPKRDSKNLYNGVLTGDDDASMCTSTNPGWNIYCDFRPLGLTVTSDVSIYAKKPSGTKFVVTINGQTSESYANTEGWIKADGGLRGPLERIETYSQNGNLEDISGIKVNNKILLNSDEILGPFGTVASVDTSGNSLTLAESYGTWGPGNTGKYAIGPSTAVDDAKKYLNLDASLNVIGLTDDDSYTRSPGNTVTPKISFPATLDNGEAPDTALPRWNVNPDRIQGREHCWQR